MFDPARFQSWYSMEIKVYIVDEFYPATNQFPISDRRNEPFLDSNHDWPDHGMYHTSLRLL